MFIDIKDYIIFSRERRREHLKLNESCIEIGGISKDFRALLAHYLKTTIPFKDNIFLCHACNNSKCSNPNHLYWGTPKDNVTDMIEAGNWKPFNIRILDKYGDDAFIVFHRRAKAAGRKSGELNKLEESVIQCYRKILIESQPEKYGWIKRAQQKINLSHTQIARFVKKYCSDIIFFERKKIVN